MRRRHRRRTPSIQVRRLRAWLFRECLGARSAMGSQECELTAEKTCLVPDHTVLWTGTAAVEDGRLAERAGAGGPCPPFGGRDSELLGRLSRSCRTCLSTCCLARATLCLAPFCWAGRRGGFRPGSTDGWRHASIAGSRSRLGWRRVAARILTGFVWQQSFTQGRWWPSLMSRMASSSCPGSRRGCSRTRIRRSLFGNDDSKTNPPVLWPASPRPRSKWAHG